MPYGIAEMRTFVRDGTGEDDVDLPNAKLDSYLNKSFWEILDKLPFRVKEKTVTFQTAVGSALYSVPASFEAIRHLSIEDYNSFEHTDVDQMDPKVYEASYANRSDSYGKPTHYVRENNFIRLYPTPDNTYTLTLKYNAELADLSDTNQYPSVPRVWYEIIELGGLWRRFLSLNDYPRVSAVKNLQRDLLSTTTPIQAKEKMDNRHAGLEVIREDNY
jgi:hypothetical protein